MTLKPKSARLAAFEEDALEIMNQWEQALVRAHASSRRDLFQSLKRCSHNLKGNAGLMGFEEMKNAVHRLEDRLIALDDDSSEKIEATLLGIFFEIERFLRTWISQCVLDANYKPDNLNVLSKIEAWTKEVDRGVSSGTSTAAPLPELSNADLSASNFDFVRIPSQKLDSLIQQVGELTLAQAIVSRGRQTENLDSAAVKEAISLGDKLVRNLRQTVLDLRMLPMAGIYTKLERAAMELSIQLQKPVHFLAEGQDVSVDKAVLNRIFDPLLHMLRNAIDHGLESPKDREAKGKNPQGTIRLTAKVVPGGVQISIQDDGRGLDHQRILKKGIEKGLVKDGQNLSEDAIAGLIFEPGFTTAEQATDISGRGIGLDVVKKELLNLSGQIAIRTVKDRGTEFSITLPTNISLIDVLVIENCGQFYCVPTQDIDEILDVKDLKIESSAAYKKMITLRNLVVPIEDLQKYLKTQQHHNFSTGGECVLIVHYKDETIGIRVDGVIDQQQVFVRPLRGYLATLNHVTGSTVLSNGEPSLIINVKGMVDEFIESKRRGERVGEQSI